MSDALISTSALSLGAAAVFGVLFKLLNVPLPISAAGALAAIVLPTTWGGGAVGFPRSSEPPTPPVEPARSA